MSAKVIKKLLKKSGKNAAKKGYKAGGKTAVKDEVRGSNSARPYGIIPSALAAPYLHSAFDTSGVPGGNAESKLMARLEEGVPSSIHAPRSDALQAMTMKMRGAEEALQGSPASLLFPDGLTTYLEAVNNPRDKPTAETRLFGLLDFL